MLICAERKIEKCCIEGAENEKREKFFVCSHHTEFVRFPRTLLQMEMGIFHGVIKTRCNGADAVVKLPADVTL
jgi:hypothetical protein